MKTATMNVIKDEFENPKFLYKDEKTIKDKIDFSNLKIEKCNQAFQLLKSIFSKIPNDTELWKAMELGWPGIESLIKNSSGYLEGDLDTILKLHGKYENYNRAKSFIDSSIFNFVKYHESEYIFKNGSFVFNQNAVKEFNNIYTYYTTNERQNNAIDAMEKLAEGLNMAFDLGLIWYDKNPKTLDAKTKVAVVKSITDLLMVNNDRVEPNMRSILIIKEE